MKFTLEDPINRFHKFSLKSLRKVKKLQNGGQGIATKDIKKGKHVHVDNITSSRN